MLSVTDMIKSGEPLEVIDAKIEYVRDKMCDLCASMKGESDEICNHCPLDLL